MLWNALQIMAAGYTDTEQDALFSGTATRVYRLPEPSKNLWLKLAGFGKPGISIEPGEIDDIVYGH